ncbi:acetyltransferase [Alteribacter natronophilus]|uniref:acetyltransferase n=1 Tax=Alteribacter natronophilus TaxID=2583810 RepID=UPI00110E4F47|nr:acetyltransferase [Alteribacter natronophilus]TMW70548.1 acetyltransferase [Alteribacter natronophilus]
MKIVLVGQGGHSKVITDMIEKNNAGKVVGYFDDLYQEVLVVDGIVKGPVQAVKRVLEENPELKLAVAIGNNRSRQEIVSMLGLPDERYATIIHPSAVISSYARIGTGTVVMPLAVVQADASVGNHVIINTGAIVEHDNIIGDFVHLCPKAALAGGVTIEEGTQVGTGTSVIPGINIGTWTTVGAGATVIKDVPAGCTAVGVPARHTRKEGENQGVKNYI